MLVTMLIFKWHNLRSYYINHNANIFKNPILEQHGQQWRHMASAPAYSGKVIRTEVQDGVGIITFDDPNSPVSSI